MKQNPVPPDQARWGRFDDLQERNFAILRDILEKAAVARGLRSANQQKIGDFYASCMDEKAEDAAKTRPLAPEMQRIAEWAEGGAPEGDPLRPGRVGAVDALPGGRAIRD